MAKKTTMTANSRKVFDFLKGNGAGVKFTVKDVQSALGFENASSVVGSVSGLARKGYAVWDKEVRSDDEGKETSVSVFYLTPEGAEYGPDAVSEDE